MESTLIELVADNFLQEKDSESVPLFTEHMLSLFEQKFQINSNSYASNKKTMTRAFPSGNPFSQIVQRISFDDAISKCITQLLYPLFTFSLEEIGGETEQLERIKSDSVHFINELDFELDTIIQGVYSYFAPLQSTATTDDSLGSATMELGTYYTLVYKSAIQSNSRVVVFDKECANAIVSFRGYLKTKHKRSKNGNDAQKAFKSNPFAVVLDSLFGDYSSIRCDAFLCRMIIPLLDGCRLCFEKEAEMQDYSDQESQESTRGAVDKIILKCIESFAQSMLEIKNSLDTADPLVKLSIGNANLSKKKKNKSGTNVNSNTVATTTTTPSTASNMVLSPIVPMLPSTMPLLRWHATDEEDEEERTRKSKQHGILNHFQSLFCFTEAHENEMRFRSTLFYSIFEYSETILAWCQSVKKDTLTKDSISIARATIEQLCTLGECKDAYANFVRDLFCSYLCLISEECYGHLSSLATRNFSSSEMNQKENQDKFSVYEAAWSGILFQESICNIVPYEYMKLMIEDPSNSQDFKRMQYMKYIVEKELANVPHALDIVSNTTETDPRSILQNKQYCQFVGSLSRGMDASCL